MIGRLAVPIFARNVCDISRDVPHDALASCAMPTGSVLYAYRSFCFLLVLFALFAACGAVILQHGLLENFG